MKTVFKMTKQFNLKLHQAFKKIKKIENAWDSFDTAYKIMNQYKTFQNAPSFVQDFVIDYLQDYENDFKGFEGDTYELVYSEDKIIAILGLCTTNKKKESKPLTKINLGVTCSESLDLPNINFNNENKLLLSKKDALIRINELKIKSGDIVQCTFNDGSVELVQVKQINYVKKFTCDNRFIHTFTLVDKVYKYNIFNMLDIKIVNRSHKSKKVLIENKVILQHDIREAINQNISKS